MGVAHAVVGGHHEARLGEARLVDRSLAAPSAVERTDPHVGSRDGQLCRGILGEHHVLLLLVAYLRPGLDDVRRLVGAVAEVDVEGHHLVLGLDGHLFAAVSLLPLHARDLQVEGYLSVGMLHVERREPGRAAVEGLVGLLVTRRVGPPHLAALPLVEAGTVVGHTWGLAGLGEQQERGVPRRHIHVLPRIVFGPCQERAQHHQEDDTSKNVVHHVFCLLGSKCEFACNLCDVLAPQARGVGEPYRSFFRSM